jgi:dTDP-N-acetylfucosamine:lipid II N-acetylfucosaminyltransferase
MAESGKILHLMGWDQKFVSSFIHFINKHFSQEPHHFIVYGEANLSDFPAEQRITYIPHLLRGMQELVVEIYSARKIVIHGLFSSHLLYFLALQPWILKKCYWIIWGGDLYVHNSVKIDWRWKKNEIFRKFVVSRIGNFVTHVKGDYELAQQWYGAKGKWHESFVYPSNLYQAPTKKPLPHEGINILLGNSADPSNNHIEVLEMLKGYRKDNIKIFCPLSYGDQSYAQDVINYGTLIFGNKFIALRDFMSLNNYTKLLSEIDVAVFNHKRQQGMGNIISLLGAGKKIYLRNDITTWQMFKNINVIVNDINKLDLFLMDDYLAVKNIERISKYFSEQNLILSLQRVFQYNH